MAVEQTTPPSEAHSTTPSPQIPGAVQDCPSPKSSSVIPSQSLSNPSQSSAVGLNGTASQTSLRPSALLSWPYTQTPTLLSPQSRVSPSRQSQSSSRISTAPSQSLSRKSPQTSGSPA